MTRGQVIYITYAGEKELRDLVAKSKQYSQELFKQSLNFNIKFFDTYQARNEKFDEIFEYIKKIYKR